MSYPSILRGLVEVLEGVSGTRAVLTYEPQAIDEAPTGYLLFDKASRKTQGGVVAVKYRILYRLCLAWQDNASAEQSIGYFINPICQAIDNNAQLHGAITSGMAAVSEEDGAQTGVIVNIGGVEFRALDTYIEVLEKAPRGEI